MAKVLFGAARNAFASLCRYYCSNTIKTAVFPYRVELWLIRKKNSFLSTPGQNILSWPLFKKRDLGNAG